MVDTDWVISVHKASKRFGADVLFESLDLEIKPGKAIRLCGPNGAGKTQFLLGLAGLVPFDEGEVVLHQDGTRKSFSSDPYLRDRDIRYIPDSLGELTFRSVAEFAFLLSRSLRPFHLGSRADAVTQFFERVRPHLEQVFGGTLCAEAPVAALSFGQQRCLAIAAAVAGPALPPRALVVDEPLTGLDASGVEEIVELLSEVKRQGVALLVAEHRPQIEKLDFAETVQFPYHRDCTEEAPPRSHPAWEGGDAVKAGRAETAPLLALDSVRAGYPGATVQCDELRLGPGEIAVITGDNGAGKTGLLKGLLGLPPTTITGRVEFEGVAVPNLAAALKSGKIRYMRQNRSSFLGLRVADVVKIAAWAGESPVPLKVLEVARRTGLRKRVEQLSAGNRALLALVQALAGRPRLALLDEPTANVDPANRVEIFSLIEHARQEWGTGFLVVEHTRLPLPARYYRIERNHGYPRLLPCG